MGAESSRVAEIEAQSKRAEILFPVYRALQLERLRLESDPSPAAQERLHAVNTQLRDFSRQRNVIEDKLLQLEPTPPVGKEHSLPMRIGLFNLKLIGSISISWSKC